MEDKIVKLNEIKERIHTIRGKQVMLDSDLAKLYGVETKRLLEQVRRNKERFPEDFMFQLTKERKRKTQKISALCLYRTRRGDVIKR